jgi:hypothetical protein
MTLITKKKAYILYFTTKNYYYIKNRDAIEQYTHSSFIFPKFLLIYLSS